MRLRLGINTCFAVKRWPETNAWLRIVHDRLGLALIQHSFDLIPDGSSDASAEALGADIRGAGGDLHSTFTGLAAYSGNLLLHPDPIQRARAEAWFGWAIRYTAAAGGR
ncbi:MAG: sugar phosphate isomerase/epimerase, partial [Chloroflexota bacterium]|nr:sugar phosphate isomerase/epimerase [Chloroflexota bacterium]